MAVSSYRELVAPYLKGYGVVDGTGSKPVDADTLFGIGSISKAFTTTAIAMLAQEGKLRLGLESGFASGDQWDNTIPGITNIAYTNVLGGAGDTTLSQFMFNREYKVDLIMWRHLFGAVTNAAYVKPFLQYDLSKSVTFKVANVTSFALRPVATPGNSSAYGTEFDGDLGYNAGGMFVGISYGVLFPFAAMRHPADVTGSTYGFTLTNPDGTTDTSNVKDADTAHAIQMRFALQF